MKCGTRTTFWSQDWGRFTVHLFKYKGAFYILYCPDVRGAFLGCPQIWGGGGGLLRCKWGIYCPILMYRGYFKPLPRYTGGILSPFPDVTGAFHCPPLMSRVYLALPWCNWVFCGRRMMSYICEHFHIMLTAARCSELSREVGTKPTLGRRHGQMSIKYTTNQLQWCFSLHFCSEARDVTWCGILPPFDFICVCACAPTYVYKDNKWSLLLHFSLLSYWMLYLIHLKILENIKKKKQFLMFYRTVWKKCVLE